MDITFFHSKRFGNADWFSGQVQSLVVAAEYLEATPVVVVVGLASSSTGFLRLMWALLPPSRQCSPHSTNHCHEATTTPTTIQIAQDFFCTPVNVGRLGNVMCLDTVFISQTNNASNNNDDNNNKN